MKANTKNSMCPVDDEPDTRPGGPSTPVPPITNPPTTA